MEYKFRAECQEDVLDLLILLPSGNIVDHDFDPFDEASPDVEVEIELKNTTLDELREIMTEVIDGHVMVQTVMPIEEYTGERNYEL